MKKKVYRLCNKKMEVAAIGAGWLHVKSVQTKHCYLRFEGGYLMLGNRIMCDRHFRMAKSTLETQCNDICSLIVIQSFPPLKQIQLYSVNVFLCVQ